LNHKHAAGNFLELRIPPVALGLLVAFIMWLSSRAVPSLGFDFAGRLFACAGLVLLGAAISISGVISFRRAKTTVNPTRPASASSLVVSGIYKFTRNPMYLGFLLGLVAWAAFLANVLAFALVPAFVIYMNLFQIRPEERALATLFEQEFAAYKSKVRRWI